MTYTFKEIIDYVMESPANINPAILKQMIMNCELVQSTSNEETEPGWVGK